MGSFLIFFGALALGLLLLLLLPFRLVFALFRKRPRGVFRRAVVVGLDGMDPRRARRLMDAGRLPNFAAVAAEGCFAPLGSTCPPISPVAWSTFATGVNPGKHAIYDFLSRDFQTYLPELSSARLTTAADGRTETALLRKSRPFWHVLGERGVPCTVLRVPISYPPEPFKGRSLSAMCAPDVRGTQGEFTVFEARAEAGKLTGGRRVCVTREEPKPGRGRVRAALPGPAVAGKTLALPLEVRWRGTDAGRDASPRRPQVGGAEAGADGTGCGFGETALPRRPPQRAVLRVGGAKVRLSVGAYTPWVALTFRSGRVKVRGIARFLLQELAPGFKLYVTPINIDPGRPAMPVAWPSSFSVYLSRLLGPFATLGLAEDTWALTEGVLTDDQFERQAYDIHGERERMFFEALALTRRGLLVCVFDLTDRMQHMFMRRALGRDASPQASAEPGGGIDAEADARIDRVYERCDALLGRVRRRLGRRDLLLVVSDHGFTTFRRCVHVNAWLRENGYLAEKADAAPEAGSSDYFARVDWSKTRAYSFGLAGVYLNLKGREAQGCVEPGAEAEALKRELSERLLALADPADGQRAVRTVYDGARVYAGPYTRRAPELVIGWFSGYRHAWDTAVGGTAGEVFSDNESKWCGDHCVDRLEVPGVLFSNRRLAWGESGPHLADIGPTLLGLWGLPPPGYMDGARWEVEAKGERG
jgi:predicted AlkP superfamily phosphohydrolase/phosphomutase